MSYKLLNKFSRWLLITILALPININILTFTLWKKNVTLEIKYRKKSVLLWQREYNGSYMPARIETRTQIINKDLMNTVK